MKLFKSGNAQRAFSMVEVLVAMVVLSVGLLGIAALYVTALQSGSSAIARMQAVNIASDLADRIRGNSAVVANYDTSVTAPAQGCVGVVCAPNDMAANDLFVLNQQITQLLPGNTSGQVTVVGALPATVAIKISWSEPNGTALSYTLVTQI
jgi:type IV pilus assembly protein PilV